MVFLYFNYDLVGLSIWDPIVMRYFMKSFSQIWMGGLTNKKTTQKWKQKFQQNLNF